MMEISNRSLLCFTIGISSLSLIGIIFLVTVVAILVGKAIDLAKRIEKFQTNITDRVNAFMTSDNYKNLRNNVRQTSQNAWNQIDSKFIEPRIAGLASSGVASLSSNVQNIEERY